jgi:hypothetical protein
MGTFLFFAALSGVSFALSYYLTENLKKVQSDNRLDE